VANSARSPVMQAWSDTAKRPNFLLSVRQCNQTRTHQKIIVLPRIDWSFLVRSKIVVPTRSCSMSRRPLLAHSEIACRWNDRCRIVGGSRTEMISSFEYLRSRRRAAGDPPASAPSRDGTR